MVLGIKKPIRLWIGGVTLGMLITSPRLSFLNSQISIASQHTSHWAAVIQQKLGMRENLTDIVVVVRYIGNRGGK